jgi:hypothetical protein
LKEILTLGNGQSRAVGDAPGVYLGHVVTAAGDDRVRVLDDPGVNVILKIFSPTNMINFGNFDFKILRF